MELELLREGGSWGNHTVKPCTWCSGAGSALLSLSLSYCLPIITGFSRIAVSSLERWIRS